MVQRQTIRTTSPEGHLPVREKDRLWEVKNSEFRSELLTCPGTEAHDILGGFLDALQISCSVRETVNLMVKIHSCIGFKLSSFIMVVL